MKRLIFAFLILMVASPLLAAPVAMDFQMFGTGTTQTVAASRYVTHVTLAASTAQTITVPAGYRFVCINANTTLYACFTGTAVVPSGAVTDGTGSCLMPGFRYLGASSGQAALTSFSVISPGVGIATFEWWK